MTFGDEAHEAEDQTMDLTIVVVTYNSASTIEPLLDSIPKGLGPLKAEIVVVDNGSQDGTPDILETRTDCMLVRSTNTGYAGGINLGVMKGHPSPAILILNPDIRVQPDSIPPLVGALDEPGVHIAAPRVINPDGHLELSLRRNPSLSRALGLGRLGVAWASEYVTEREAYATSHDADWALGAALLISRHSYHALGGWDESYFLYSEETDFCLRAAELGMRTRYVPDSEVIHIGGASGRNDKTHMMQIVNRVRLYNRRNPTSKAWLYWALTILSEASWLARGHRQSLRAMIALVRPSARPPELGCSSGVLPR